MTALPIALVLMIAAASISGPDERMRPDRDPFLGEMICETCPTISASLGYTPRQL